MQLVENIREYYFAHLGELTEEKQFHFCTRIAAWEGDERALSHLAKLRPNYVPDPCTRDTLKPILEAIITRPPAVPANAANLRDPYFQKYPWLRGLELGLFRVRHLKEVYGVDARPALFDIASRQQLLANKQRLMNDTDALRVLSTYAVNYIYLLERQILQHNGEDALDLHLFYDLGNRYNVDDPLELQLYIYLYTHCIIADSNFYNLPVPTYALTVYQKMLGKLEAALKTKFDQLSLDAKLEFLVCCRICGYDTPLANAMYEECEKSVSPEGTFVIDTHNGFAGRQHKASFDASEHRNALLIMSASPYQPHSILVS